MFNAISRALFGTRNDKLLKTYGKKVEQINALEPQISALTDEALAAKTVEFRQRLADGATLDDILPEAFAVVREAAKRVMGTRHYDVQLLGGITLHEGKIPEMRTGEGKTQVALLPVYLNALAGKGVHVVTVNDYLAQRDSEWMGQVYNFLGMTVGVIQENMSTEDRRDAYNSDITYSTNNQLGFDYLRDNMVYRTDDMVQRPFHYAIIDEVDSILIDEARTPLIISGPSDDTTDMYFRVDEIVKELIRIGNADPNLPQNEVRATDNMPGLGGQMTGTKYTVQGYVEQDEKTRTVLLTDEGTEKVQGMLRDAGLLETGDLYDPQNILAVHHVNQALRANKAYKRDRDYIVKDDQIIIIDEFTGRMMQGRRFGEGLHQALEAKEGVTVQRETQTLASITFQNFFRLYPKFAGMTGTAKTEASEFSEIYNLEVISIPTHRPVQRIDTDDEIYRTAREKNAAIAKLVKEIHARQQPVLVGTTSIEKSEQLSALFKQEKIPHSVLNARHHEQEAYIVAQAGRPGAVTVATNMAGRGTDIKLGGNVEMTLEKELKGDETPEQIAALKEKIAAQVEKDKELVKAAGGLYVIGTERHESRRIDNQLRGRSGRQGDPGASKFYISLDDDLMRIFGAERIDTVLRTLGIKDGQAIMHPWINKAIERAQKKVEAQHFGDRRNVLRMDNVVNDQRKVIYEQRRQLMTADSLSDMVHEIFEDVVLGLIETHIPRGSYKEQWNIDGLHHALEDIMQTPLTIREMAEIEGIGEEEMTDKILEIVEAHWAKKRADFIESVTRFPQMFNLAEGADESTYREYAMDEFTKLEREVVLQRLDKAWKDHLLNLDHVRQGIGLRQIAQKDPLNEYKAEAFTLFRAMLDDFRYGVTQTLLGYRITTADDLHRLLVPRIQQEMHETRIDPALGGFGESDPSVAGLRGEPQLVTQRPFVKLAVDTTDPATWNQTPRNALCPCGSGKKYKYCHGAVAANG